MSLLALMLQSVDSYIDVDVMLTHVYSYIDLNLDVMLIHVHSNIVIYIDSNDNINIGSELTVGNINSNSAMC